MHFFSLLARTPVYQQFERDFSAATRLPLALRPLVISGPPLNDKPHANPVCRLLGRNQEICTTCVRLQSGLCTTAGGGVQSFRCFAGFQAVAVPVQVGKLGVIGFLQTGQVLPNRAHASQLERLLGRLPRMSSRRGTSQIPGRIEQAWKQTSPYPQGQFLAATRLLSLFGRQLEAEASTLLAREQAREHPNVARARRFVEAHWAREGLSVGDVAVHVHTSVPYLCALFKEGTGLTFTDYLGRVRVEQTKRLLRENLHLRVSEIAYRVGFRSLSQFNRTFSRVAGLAPNDYRSDCTQRCAGRGLPRPTTGKAPNVPPKEPFERTPS